MIVNGLFKKNDHDNLKKKKFQKKKIIHLNS
jgi:hypothetical protein